MKTCSRCKIEKPVTEFFVSRKSRSVDGLHNVCKECSKEYSREWYLKNRESKEGIVLKSNARLSHSEYIKMFDDQNGVCAICGTKQTIKRLAIDHCHKTNVVRGLLCNKCNIGLGWFLDDEVRLQKAIEYLKKSRM